MKFTAAAPFLPALLLFFSAFSCGAVQTRRELSVRMAEIDGAAGDDDRTAELRGRIRGVERDVERTLESVQDKGTYWRLLGMKYMDYQMWGEAYKALDEAVSIYPQNAALLYNRSLCAAQTALSADSPEERRSLIQRAEAGYRRALDVDPRYTPAMYALAVILIFENDSPQEAAGRLEDYLEIERSDTSARFLLARAYLSGGRDGDALRLYDQIIRLASEPAEKAKAEELYRRTAEGDRE